MKNPKIAALALVAPLLMTSGAAFAENAGYAQLRNWIKLEAPVAPSPVFTADKSIYGENSMHEYYQVPERLKKLADSSVAFVSRSALYFDPAAKVYRIRNSQKLSDMVYADENEDFSSQGKLSNCSGAYLGKGLVMTAGHCVSANPENDSFFGNYFLVFGWKYAAEGAPSQEFQPGDVYTIRKVEVRVFDGENGDPNRSRDFALVALDREPAGRQPLELEREAAPKIGRKVFTIGYPLGLAVKINDPDQAQVFTVGQDVFQTNLDVFGGNSGGPAFDSATNRIIGIVVTAVGTEYSYELNRDFSFIAEFSLPSNTIVYAPELGTATFGSELRSMVLRMVRDAKGSIKLLDENKCLVTFPKGSKFETRSLFFSVVTRVGGQNVFNRGRLMRDQQDSYGTGVMRLPDEIKSLVQP